MIAKLFVLSPNMKGQMNGVEIFSSNIDLSNDISTFPNVYYT